MQRLATAALAAALMTLPLAAGAAESNGPPDFAEADANGDGVVTIEEAVDAGVPESEAKREDIDADGELSEADWKFVDLSPASGEAQGAADDTE